MSDREMWKIVLALAAGLAIGLPIAWLMGEFINLMAERLGGG